MSAAAKEAQAEST